MIMEEALAEIAALSIALRESAHHYSECAKEIEQKQLLKLFHQLITTREQYADQLNKRMHNAGELPREPDRDLEGLTDLLEKIGSSIAQDSQTAILHQRLKGEEKLAHQVNKTRQLNAHGDAADLLSEIRLHIANSQTQLENALP